MNQKSVLDHPVALRVPELVTQEASSVRKEWYVPPARPAQSGWLVYSFDFVLAALQGCITEPDRVRRTPPWLMIATVFHILMAVLQAVIMTLARIPVVSWFVEILARTFTRNAAGFFLRACYWKSRLKFLGQDTIIDQGVEIWGPANISIGSHCHIDTNVRMAAGERRHGQHGRIQIDDSVHIGPSVHIAGRGGVEIQALASIGASVHIYSATNTIEHPDDPGRLISMSHMAPPAQQHTFEKPVVVEGHAFIGMMSRVMPGVRVGRGAIIHVGMNLTRDVQPFANFGGVPPGRQIGWRRPRRASPMLAAAKPGPDQRSPEGLTTVGHPTNTVPARTEEPKS